jgi:hypothetical protein
MKQSRSNRPSSDNNIPGHNTWLTYNLLLFINIATCFDHSKPDDDQNYGRNM